MGIINASVLGILPFTICLRDLAPNSILAGFYLHKTSQRALTLIHRTGAALGSQRALKCRLSHQTTPLILNLVEYNHVLNCLAQFKRVELSMVTVTLGN